MAAIKTGAIAVAGAAVLFGAGSARAEYSFIVIAEAPDAELGFSEVLTGSLNDNGDVTFAVITDLAPGGAVYRVAAPGYGDDDRDLIDGSADLSATGPVIADRQAGSDPGTAWIAFVGADSAKRGVRLDDGVDPDPDWLVNADNAALRFFGQLAISSPDGLVAFWSTQLGQPGAPHFIDVVSPDQTVTPVDSAAFPASLAGPAIADNGLVAYLEQRPVDESLGVYVAGAGDPVFSVSFPDGGLLSAPSINASGTVAVFIQEDNLDPPTTAGIYTNTAGGTQVRKVALSVPGGLAPVPSTRVFINDDNDLAYVASFAGLQAIFTGEDPGPEPVIVAGGEIDGGQVVNGTLQLFGFNNCEQVLLKADLDDGGAVRSVLVLATTVAVCSDYDLDGDGLVGVTDLLILLAEWGTDPGGPPDFDGDGTVGITDFLSLLANWS